MYEVGQEVECIDPQGSKQIKRGKTYTVAEVFKLHPRENKEYVRLKEIQESYGSHSYCTTQFKPIGPKFKKGETVRVIGDSSGQHKHGIEIGTEVKILDGWYGRNIKYSVKPDRGWLVWEQDLELVTPQDVEKDVRIYGKFKEEEDMRRVVSVMVIDHDENVKEEDSIVVGKAVYATSDSTDVITYKMKETLKAGALAKHNAKRVKCKDDKGENLEKVIIADLEIRIIEH
jgi:hypothetical protein